MWTENDIQVGWKFPPNVDVFNNAWQYRKNQYPISDEDINEFSYISDEIDTKGYFVLKNVFDRNDIKKLYEETKHHFEVDDKSKLRHKKIEQPLINSPEIIPYVFNDYSLRIAMSYLKCYPALGTLNFRKSFVNDIEREGVQMFHIDPNSPRFIKFFIYLNDVDDDGDGPFCIVEGSHKKRFDNRYSIHRWPDKNIQELYGKDKIKKITAKMGDMIIATTNCFHRGTKCRNKERTMLTLNYVCHPEEFREPTFQINKSDYDNLVDYKKPLTDFLVKV